MKLKRRRKSRRQHGSQTHGRGAKERTRGSGNRGGYGMAGTGKRADQKKTLVINQTGGNNYFGKDKTLRRGRVAPRLRVINLTDIEQHLHSFVKEGKAKETSKGVYSINLEGYKLLGEGELTQPLNIRASAASASAIEKVRAAKGALDIIGKTEGRKEEKKMAKK